jgi:hypothetical protein
MIYKGYKIEACIKQAEMWSLDDGGFIDRYLRDCPIHDDDPVIYKLMNNYDEVIASSYDLDGVKKYVDALTLGLPA